MRHVAIFGDDLESFDCFCVADDVVQEDGSVFLYPANGVSLAHASRSISRTREVRSQVQQMLLRVLEHHSGRMRGLQSPFWYSCNSVDL